MAAVWMDQREQDEEVEEELFGIEKDDQWTPMMMSSNVAASRSEKGVLSRVPPDRTLAEVGERMPHQTKFGGHGGDGD